MAKKNLSEQAQSKDYGTSMTMTELLEFLPIIFKTDMRPVLMGGTGTGKTEVIKQYAMSLNKDLVIIYTSQIEPADFIGLYKTTEDGRTMNCPPNWMPKELVFDKANGKSLKDVMPKAGGNPNGTIIFLDEFNRGKEDIRQAMYQFLSQKRIHTYILPDNCDIVCAANPSNAGNYEVYDLDDALVNRLAWVKLKPTFQETQNYLAKKHGNNLVIDWLNIEKGATLDYGADFEIEGKIYSPRVEEAHIILYNLIKDKPQNIKMKFLSTCIKPETVQSFLSFEEEMSHISYKDILDGKAKTQVKDLVREGKMDVLSTLTIHLSQYFKDTATKETKEEEAKNLSDFLDTVPEELITVFIDTLGQAYESKTCVVRHDYFRKKLKPKFETLKKEL